MAGSCAPAPPPENVTVPVYPVATLPLASRAATSREKVEPAVAVAGAETSSVVAGPGVKVTATEFAKGEPSRVAETVATPALVEDVSVPDTVPSPLSVAEPTDPRDVVNA